MNSEQLEIIAKLKEIEDQTRLLLAEVPTLGTLPRARVMHIQGLSGYLRTMIGSQLTLVKKDQSA